MEREQVKDFLHIVNKIVRISNNNVNFGYVPRAEFFCMSMILSYCTHNDSVKGITVTQLAQIMEMSRAATSKLLRVLEGKGYIKRIHDEHDRRVVYIYLSEDGEKLLKHAMESTESKYIEFLGKMGEKDSAELMRLTKKLLLIMQYQNENNQRGDVCENSF